MIRTAIGTFSLVFLGAMGISDNPGMQVIEVVPKLLWGGFGTYTDDVMVSSTLRLCLDY